MSEITKILAPVSNVNDTSVVIYEFLVENNSYVTAEQDVIAIETSKATKKLIAPCAGFIRFTVEVGDEVPNGNVLAIVADSIGQLDDYKSDKEEKEQQSPLLPTDFITFGLFDHPVTLGEIMVQNGEQVEKDTILCKIRDGKKVDAVPAPGTGYVFWNKKPYETVHSGEYIGVISDSASQDIFPEIDSSRSDQKYISLRLSKAAKQLLDDRGLIAEDLGLSGLVSVNDVLDKLNPDRKNVQRNAVESAKATSPKTIDHVFHSTNGNYEKLSQSKRSEVNFLSTANRDAVVSQISVLVPTQGIISACAEDSELARRFSAIIIFETSRLLKSYRRMNSVYDDGQLFVYDSINVGYALSIEDDLKVPVFKNSDQKGLEAIISEKEQFIEKYISNNLSPEDLSEGTFTITDLSSTGCYMFNPVLNLGQSVILGVGGENSSHTDYPIILAYDHRVVDGATATEFLCTLRDRLIAHENVLIGKPKKEELTVHGDELLDSNNLCCEACFRTADEIEEMGHYLLKTIDKTGKEKYICSICVRGW